MDAEFETYSYWPGSQSTWVNLILWPLWYKSAVSTSFNPLTNGLFRQSATGEPGRIYAVLPPIPYPNSTSTHRVTNTVTSVWPRIGSFTNDGGFQRKRRQKQEAGSERGREGWLVGRCPAWWPLRVRWPRWSSRWSRSRWRSSVSSPLSALSTYSPRSMAMILLPIPRGRFPLKHNPYDINLFASLFVLCAWLLCSFLHFAASGFGPATRLVTVSSQYLLFLTFLPLCYPKKCILMWKNCN